MSNNMTVFGYVSSFISAFADAFVMAYEAEEAAAFRARNRELAVEVAMVAAALGYEAIDSLVKFLVARAAKDTAVVVASARASYYTKSTVSTLEQGYSLWLQIGDTNHHIFETTLVYGAVTAAFFVTLVRVWAEEQVESCLIVNEDAASEEQLSIEGFTPFALLCPVVEQSDEVEPIVVATSVVIEEVEPVAPSFQSYKAKSLVKGLGSLAKAKSILKSSARSWASLAADLILFATEGGYSTLEEAVSVLKASI